MPGAAGTGMGPIGGGVKLPIHIVETVPALIIWVQIPNAMAETIDKVFDPTNPRAANWDIIEVCRALGTNPIILPTPAPGPPPITEPCTMTKLRLCTTPNDTASNNFFESLPTIPAEAALADIKPLMAEGIRPIIFPVWVPEPIPRTTFTELTVDVAIKYWQVAADTPATNIGNLDPTRPRLAPLETVNVDIV
jgi:hypothetical protein